MTNDCRTSCTCVIPEGQLTGWCERHRCRKTASWIKLCQTRPDYFQLWEEGRGPGQYSPVGEGTSTTPPPSPRSFPSTARMAWNLAAAVADFAADLAKRGVRGALVDADEYERRLAICESCVPPDGYRTGNRCSHQKCGCFLSVKAKGRAFHCPIKKW